MAMASYDGYMKSKRDTKCIAYQCIRPPPIFVVHLKHLDHRLKQVLAKLDKWSKDYVMKEAIGRIFEHVDRRFYYLSAKPLLDWKLEN